MKGLARAAALFENRAAVLRVCAAALAAVLVLLGALALSDYGGRAGLSPEAAAAAGDGPLTVSGEVGRIFSRGGGAETVVSLRGASSFEVRFAGDLTGSYIPGDFVTAEGVKLGGDIDARAIRHAVSPGSAAAPYLAAGGVIAGLLAADFAVPRWERPGAPRGAWAARLRRLVARRQRDGGSEADGPEGER